MASLSFSLVLSFLLLFSCLLQLTSAYWKPSNDHSYKPWHRSWPRNSPFDHNHEHQKHPKKLPSSPYYTKPHSRHPPPLKKSAAQPLPHHKPPCSPPPSRKPYTKPPSYKPSSPHRHPPPKPAPKSPPYHPKPASPYHPKPRSPSPYHPKPRSPTPYHPKPTSPSPSHKYPLAAQFLAPHNAARSKLGLPPLVWNDTVADYAQWWANQRRLDGNCQMQHSHGPYGENIFWGIGYPYGPKDCVDAWVEEEAFYHYDSNSCDPNEQCGHYTQIVWKNSVRLGCARVECSSGDIFMTCNYDPPGNWIGYKPY